MSDPDFSIIENSELFNIFSKFLPSEDIDKIKEVTKIAASKMLLSPNTAQVLIEDTIQSYSSQLSANTFNILSENQLIPKLIELIEFVISTNEIIARLKQEDMNRLAVSPKATILNEFLLNSFSQNSDILPLISKGGVPLDTKPIFAANPIIHIIMKNPGENITPEMQFRMGANIIATTAELWYNPLLKIILEITRILTNKNNDIPNELGRVMSQCNDLWKNNYTKLLCLLDDRIRIIRNSEAHKDTIIDVRNQTITFINSKANESVGPLTQEELAMIVNIGNFCIDMNTAFRVAEHQIKEKS